MGWSGSSPLKKDTHIGAFPVTTDQAAEPGEGPAGLGAPVQGARAPGRRPDGDRRPAARRGECAALRGPEPRARSAHRDRHAGDDDAPGARIDTRLRFGRARRELAHRLPSRAPQSGKTPRHCVGFRISESGWRYTRSIDRTRCAGESHAGARRFPVILADCSARLVRRRACSLRSGGSPGFRRRRARSSTGPRFGVV